MLTLLCGFSKRETARSGTYRACRSIIHVQSLGKQSVKIAFNIKLEMFFSIYWLVLPNRSHCIRGMFKFDNLVVLVKHMVFFRVKNSRFHSILLRVIRLRCWNWDLSMLKQQPHTVWIMFESTLDVHPQVSTAMRFLAKEKDYRMIFWFSNYSVCFVLTVQKANAAYISWHLNINLKLVDCKISQAKISSQDAWKWQKRHSMKWNYGLCNRIYWQD